MRVEDLYALNEEQVYDLLIAGEVSFVLFQEYIDLRIDNAVDYVRTLHSKYS
jgi:hypothetical protein